MIGKQIKGKSFGGVLNYILSKDDALILDKNMLSTSARELSAEFGQSRKLHPNLKRAVYHASLSLPPGEHLSDDKWREISRKYLDEMGFSGSQYVTVGHQDTAHDHVHMVASRISLDGSVVSESHDFQRSESVLRGLEREHGLTPVISSREARQRSLSRADLDQGYPDKARDRKHRVQHYIDHAATGNPTMSKFLKRLEAFQVDVHPNQAKTGHVSGISFRFEGERMTGSDLGRAYTWASLQKRKGVSYDRNRDQPAIQKAIISFQERGHSGDLGRLSSETPSSTPRARSSRQRGAGVGTGALGESAGFGDPRNGSSAANAGNILRSETEADRGSHLRDGGEHARMGNGKEKSDGSIVGHSPHDQPFGRRSRFDLVLSLARSIGETRTQPSRKMEGFQRRDLSPDPGVVSNPHRRSNKLFDRGIESIENEPIGFWEEEQRRKERERKREKELKLDRSRGPSKGLSIDL